MKRPLLIASALLVLAVTTGSAQDLDALLGTGEPAPAATPAPAREEPPPAGEEAGAEEAPPAEEPAVAPAPETRAEEAAAAEPPAAAAQAAQAGAEAQAPARGGRTIEEIIVTAQKTEQNIRDVPISMSVLDDEFIAQQNITDYRDLALYTPNAHVDPGNGLFPDINVRGFGSALSNKAFEQSVGLVLDGIPYGRTGYFQGPLFDIDRVELLRGPQGTLFGKNTTAGLLNIVTKRPTDEYTGFIAGELGELDRRRLEAGIGGPAVPGILNVRLSGLIDERDGLVENTTAATVPGANEDMNGRERKAGRIQLGLPNVFGADVVVGYEHIDFDFTGIGWEWNEVPENVKPFYRLYDPNTDFRRNNWVGSVDTDEFNRNTIDTVFASAGYDLGAWGIDAVSGWSKLRVRSLIDDDFGPQPMLFNTSFDDNPQTTFELRLTSPTLPGFLGLERPFGLPLGDSDFVAGFFFQKRDLENSRLSINFNLPVLAQFAAFNNSPEGTPIGPLSDFIGPAVPIPPLGTFDTNDGAEETTMHFAQTTTSLAGFSHLTWRLAPRWTLQYGMRFAQESKEADWNRFVSKGTGALFEILGGQATFTTSRERSEFKFTPKVSLNYDVTDEITTYFSWGQGFKAGGFNEQVFNTSDESLEFATEEATAWELGTKTRFLDGAAAVNLALFWQDVTDFQVLTLPPNSVATTVVNAGEARARGVELDGNWLPASWLTLFATLAFNDSEFLSFPLGQCSFDRPDTDGNGDGRCDVSGQPLFRTPKWSSSLTGDLRYPLASIVSPERMPLLSVAGLELVGGGTIEYQDVQYLERTFDPRVRQSPFFRFGASIGLGNSAKGWSVRLVGQNLSNEPTDVLIRDVPLGGGNFAAIQEPQRLFFGAVRWAF